MSPFACLPTRWLLQFSRLCTLSCELNKSSVWTVNLRTRHLRTHACLTHACPLRSLQVLLACIRLKYAVRQHEQCTKRAQCATAMNGSPCVLALVKRGTKSLARCGRFHLHASDALKPPARHRSFKHGVRELFRYVLGHLLRLQMPPACASRLLDLAIDSSTAITRTLRTTGSMDGGQSEYPVLLERLRSHAILCFNRAGFSPQVRTVH